MCNALIKKIIKKKNNKNILLFSLVYLRQTDRDQLERKTCVVLLQQQHQQAGKITLTQHI